MSTASDLEIVEETPAPQTQPSTSGVPKRKGRPPAAQSSSAEQSGSSTKKAKASPPNGSTNGASRSDKAAMEELKKENEELRRQLAEAVETAEKFQEDFSKLQNLRHSDPEAALRDYIAKSEERERLLQEQNQTLMEQNPVLAKLVQPSSSGAITLLTREDTDAKLQGYRNEVQNLRARIEEQNQAIEKQNQVIEDLNESLRNTQLELDEEIKRSTKLSAQAAERPGSNRSGGSIIADVTKNDLKLALYEDLTTIKIHNVKQLDTEELGRVIEMECDSTTYEKTLYFKLHMYKSPAVVDGDIIPNQLVDTVRYIPLGLELEKDLAFLEGLGILGDTFTFVKDTNPFDRQMWEFCMEINRGLTRWKDEAEEEEEEEDDDDAVIVEDR